MRKMKKKDIIKILKEYEKEIKKYGIKKIGIFGSAVRDELHEDSDIDIVVEFEEEKGTFENFGGLVDFLENILGREVDILTPGGIENIRIKYIKEKIKKEVEYV